MALVVSSGCVADAAESGPALGAREAAARPSQDPGWEFCAHDGEYCEFSGTRQVRYGRRGEFVVRTFSERVLCVGSSFDTARQRRAICEVEIVPEAPPPPPPGTEPDAGVGEIDVDAIPAGFVGYSDVRIRETAQLPGPSDGTGIFRTVCEYSHMNFDDPIVYPGEEGRAHLHAYFGNTGTNAHSTPESLTTSGNGTCRGGIANRSAYWVPAMIDPAGKPLAPLRMHVYYKSGYGGVPPADVEVFPPGLRMIAGSDLAHPESIPSYFINYTCISLGYSRSSVIPDCPANDVLAMTIQFPQCWNGVDLDSPDHRSHMAYANGGCPASHPIALPELTFVVEYAVPAGGNDGWRLSSDMAGELPGQTLHGDWMEGWDPAIAQEFVDHCINPAVDCFSHLLGPNREIY